MRKLFHTLFTLTLVLIFSEAKAQITVGAVDPGPYGYGSNITVPITVSTTACLPRLNNKFELYISDPLGNFVLEQKIGEYAGFYTTFINGVIPSTLPLLLPGDFYKLRIKISGTGTIVNVPGTIGIRIFNMPAVGVTPSVASQVRGIDTYGFCGSSISDNQSMILTNNSAASTTVQLNVRNDITGTSQNYTPGGAGFQITGIANAYYTATLTGQQVVGLETIKSNKSYLLLNSSSKTNIQSTGDGFGCIDPTAGNIATIGYSVNIDGGTNGIRNNYPGSIYRIGWGDGSADDIYTHCQLIAQNGIISHNFSRTSCGQPPINLGNGNQVTNSFSVSVTTLNPNCTESTTAIAYAKVFVKPTAIISPSVPTACTNTPVTFGNGSILGNNSDCTTVMSYEWYVDGVLESTSPTFVYSFPTHDNHIVTLITKNDVGICAPSVATRSICIQDRPQPSFTLPSPAPLTLCAPGVVTPVNTSIIDNICNQNNTYLWTVSGPGPVAYDVGSATSRDPVFRLATPGVYTIKLSITTASCGLFTTPEQTVVVNGPPTVALSPDIALCNFGTYNFNNTTTGPTRTTFSGTFNEVPDTYTWTVTGGAFTFANGTTANSKFPDINFSEFNTYTVTATHTNTCGTVSDAQVITFTPSPQVNAGADQNICFNDIANLSATINAPVVSYQWIGGAGVFGSGRNSMTTTYTPTAAERLAGRVTLTFRATTALAAPCNTIDDEIIINIKPEITVTSPSTASTCTGSTTFSYQPTATPANTTFTYTATGTANAGGFTASGTTFPIQDVLTTSDPAASATVTYIITPVSDGCTGAPFTLTVTVTPRPVITAVPTAAAICTRTGAGIIITSNLPGTTYTWTSAAVNGITGASTMLTPTTNQAINDILINAGTSSGTVTYSITPISASGCSGTPVDVTVQVDPAVTAAIAGTDESICNTDSYTLTGNLPSVGTGTWTLTSGQTGVTITPTTNVNASVTGLQGGQSYTFRWTISAPGACASSQDEVVITVNTPTIPGTTGTTDPAVVCAAANTGTITLTGNTGSVLNWQSLPQGATTWVDIPGTANTLTYTYNNITVSTQYRAVVKNGGCTTEYSAATSIIVTPATTIAQVGPDRALCAETTVTLTADPTLQPGESGLWTQTSGPATVTIPNPSNPTVTATGLVPGQTYTFTWTISGNSPCGPTHDDVIITDYLPLTNTISSTSTEVCYNQVIAITGSTPTGGDGTYSYLWEVSTDGGANWNAIPGQTGKDLSYQLQTTSSFRRTVTSNICPLISNVIQIIAQQPITNNTIAAGQSICTGTVPDALTGNTPAGSDGNFNYQWQFSEDNGATWANVNGAVSLSYAPLALTTTTVYRRLVSTIACNGALQSISNPVTIIVRPNAKAEYTFTTDRGCTPFVIDANNIRAVAYPDRNATYSWYADNVLIGTGITFPGYTIATTDQSVTIKLVTAPSQGCQPDEFSHVFSTNQSVAPSYTQSATQGCGPLIVNFVNTSTSLTNATFTWDFGNGVTSSQTMPAPVTFQPDPTGIDRTYTVTLTATTSCGSNSVTSTVFVKAKPKSVFSPSRTVGCSPMLVTFSNTSPGETNTYSYDFGDGSPLVTTTDKSSVQHTYLTNTVKSFVVTMTAQNECGSDQSSYTIQVSPNTVTAELVVNADQKVGCAPFTVNFYNNSRGASSFIYDFGDGSTLVTRSAPEVVNHTFTTAGTYNVTLTASNGCSEITTSESITVLPQPVAAFSADNVLGCPGLVVQFRNTSTNGISYLWDFGDGTTSQETAPQHVYAGTQEFYTVSLTATNSLGCTYTAALNQYIHIVQPPVAQFNVLPSTLISIPNYTFRFEDESTNTPTIWLWDFGDHTTSALKNPSHTYQDVGTYTVTLKVTNQQGCFTTTFKDVTIAGVPGYLYVPNSFMPGSATSELRVFGAKGSGIKAWTMTIFNKWGQQLWLTNKLDEGRPVESWDGTFNSVPVPQGVYFWKIDVEFINGSAWKGMTYDSSAPKKTGVIHLLR